MRPFVVALMGLVACGDDGHAALDGGGFDAALADACTPIASNAECNPLVDNNFLGAPQGCGCGSGLGCYGFPSFGTPPVTAFSCQRVLAGADSLVHRSQLTGSMIYTNSCAAGYEPILKESATVSTTICVAICKPLNCYAGNCGANDENRLGAAPHRCTSTDRRGTFDNGPDGEHCQFWWRREVDSVTGEYLPSMWGNTIGICFDHSKYQYDSNGDQTPDAPLPACKDLQDGFGSGTTLGAGDLGCVDSSHVNLAAGKRGPRPLDDLRLPYRRR